MTLHRGKIAREPTVLNVRALTRDDLMVLREDRGPTERSGGGIVQRLRDPHHRMARLVAAGLRPDEIVARSGYTHSRYNTLKNDPAFQELVAKYREKVDAAFIREADTFYELATSNMITAERMIAEKLEEHDENGTLPSFRELMPISRDAADRFGYGKRQTNLNVNADFAKLLEDARKRSAGANAKVIEATPIPPEPLSQSSPVTVVPAASSQARHPSLPLIRRRA